MTVAFVLPGGAALGAAQVGMLRALDEAGIRPDILVGTSAGAINACYLGLHPGPTGIAGMARLWGSVRRRDLVRLRPRQAVRALAGRHPALFDRSGLERLVGREFDGVRLEELAFPVAVVAADALTGEPVILSRGPANRAVLASSAMPGVLAPVPWGERWLVDGSVAPDAPLVKAQELGASVIWVLTTSSRPTRPPRGALDLAVHAFSLVAGCTTEVQLDRVRQHATVHVLPPPVADGPGVFDLRSSSDLIAEAHRTAARWLAETGAMVGAGSPNGVGRR